MSAALEPAELRAELGAAELVAAVLERLERLERLADEILARIAVLEARATTAQDALLEALTAARRHPLLGPLLGAQPAAARPPGAAGIVTALLRR